MIYLPLFGKDSVPQTSSRIFGLSFTIFIWIVLFGIFSLIRPAKEKKERYTTVQIVLEDREIPEEEIIPEIKMVGGSEGSSSLEKDNSEPVIKTVASAKTTAPKISKNQAKSSSKSNESSTTTSAYKQPASAPQDYSKSVDDLMSAQLNGTKKAAVWDESLFQDTTNAVTNSNSQSTNTVVNKETSLSGSAGSVNKENTSQTSKKVSTNSNSDANASETTTQALSRISTASYSATSEGAKTTSSMNTSKSSEGKLQIEMQDGSVRTLIEPLYPSISLSKEASDLIDIKVTVTISFRVNENGNVLQVSFQNQSILPEKVRNEIEAQIMKWRFESAPYSSNAQFKYTIEKR